VDFYLWFRYEGEIDAANIRFMNAVDPITPGHPMDAILRNIFPEMVMIICLYLVYFIPYRHFRLRVEIMMAVLISCAF